jgi:hypothetical protein
MPRMDASLVLAFRSGRMADALTKSVNFMNSSLIYRCESETRQPALTVQTIRRRLRDVLALK